MTAIYCDTRMSFRRTAHIKPLLKLRDPARLIDPSAWRVV
jgi:hypothetical protein